MKDSKKYAFFLDMDNTIIPPMTDCGVSEKLRNTIEQEQKNGHVFFINSGRAYSYISKKTLASASFDGVVSGQGSYITYHGKPIYSAYIPMEAVREIAYFCAENNESCTFEGISDTGDGRLSIGKKCCLDLPETYLCVEKFLAEAEKCNFIKVTIQYIPDGEYDKLLKKHFEMQYIYSQHYSEGTVPGHNKGKGMLRACELIGVENECCVAMGDSENDVQMLSAAGISVAMGNSPDDIKNMCTMVTDDVYHDGAANAILKILGK